MAEKLYDAYHQEIELTTEQQACLKYAGDRTLMVKGYAGAGKSLVLMAIAQKFLAKYGHKEKNRVGIFTFQNTLVSTTKEFLHVNGGDDEGVLISTVNSYLKSIYDDLVRAGKAPKQSYPNTNRKDRDKPKRLKAVEIALNKHQTKYGKHRFHDLPYEFWLDEFDWMKDMNIGKDDLDAYILYKRKGRGNKYRFSSADYATAFQIYTFYLAYQSSTGQGDWADQPMFLIRNRDLIPESYKFDHILIDEAQDLSLAQMTALMLLYRKDGDMIVAMDANQKIHGKYWTPKLLGIEATTKKLTKSMRTTKQIDNLAESVRSKNDKQLDEDDKNLRALPEREGPMPKLVHLEDQAAERKYVVELVKAYIKANPNMTIGIIAAKNSQIDLYSDWLTSASPSIPHEQVRKDTTFSMAKPGVKVASAFSAKGLEFNVVIIPMFAEGFFPYKYLTDDEEEMEQYMIKMRNLVYVSMTRAKNILVISWWGNGGSRFIADMDPSLYETEGLPFKINASKQTNYSKASSISNTSIATTTQTTPMKTTNSAVSSAISPITSTASGVSELVEYLKSNGLEVIDKRDRGGALWVIGGKELDAIIKESRKLYGALWTFSQNGGTATRNRTSWFTKCTK